jgi:beta-1,4-mannosyl-glycoprotein beta-1,4-N-acetylglucosaminyltransferase
MIYDCFPFFNELDLLEIRLHELYDVVDSFIISEATVTHQNQPKKLNYDLNKDRFKDFESKIIYDVIEDASNIYCDNAWNIDHYMHDHFIGMNYIKNDEDIIIIDDADQIPRASIFSSLDFNTPMCLSLEYCYYYFNCVHTTMKWNSSFIIKKGQLHNSIHDIRYHPDIIGINFRLIQNAGWHFSYLGNINHIKEKIHAFSDTQAKNFILDEKQLLDRIMRGEDLYGRTCEGPMSFVELDESFPKYIIDNKERFKEYIK